jgi:hypothetical protein
MEISMDSIKQLRRGMTLVDALVGAAASSVLGAIVFPILIPRSRESNVVSLQKISTAAVKYGDDFDERIPLSMNGPFRDLVNVHDGKLTNFGEHRADMWPLLLVPYLKDRKILVDPERKDRYSIFAGPPLAPGDKGFVETKNTYRNQNRFAFFGMNYLFLSPLIIPAERMSDKMPTDFMAAEPKEFFNAFDPHATVFFVPSTRYHMEPGDSRGFSDVNAPGTWAVFSASTVPYVAFTNGTPCSADWCGQDIDPKKPGRQTSEAAFYPDPGQMGNNVSFLDTHVKFLKSSELAAGTDYLTASPQGFGMPDKFGGAVIIDKHRYIWNLDDNYYGA